MEILFILHTPALLPLDAAVAAGTFLLVFFFFFTKRDMFGGFLYIPVLQICTLLS